MTTISRSMTFSALITVAILAVSLIPAISSAEVEKADAFVCPVISTEAVLNSPNGAAIGEGHYTIGGPDVSVPVHATNGDGTGTPSGPHSEPGDTDYTGIWARQ